MISGLCVCCGCGGVDRDFFAENAVKLSGSLSEAMGSAAVNFAKVGVRLTVLKPAFDGLQSIEHIAA